MTIIASIAIFGRIPGVDVAQETTIILYDIVMPGIGRPTLIGNIVIVVPYYEPIVVKTRQ